MISRFDRIFNKQMALFFKWKKLPGHLPDW